MNVGVLALLLGTFAPLASAAAAGERCSCDDLRECTQVNDIPVVFATRDVVRDKFTGLGARLLEHGTWSDDFSAPAGVPYGHVTAFYSEERRLAKLRLSYPAQDFAALREDFSGFDAVASQTTEKGVAKYWRMRDGVEIEVWRDDAGSFVEFTSLAVDAQLSAQLRPDDRPAVSRFAPADDAAAPPRPAIRLSNPHQGRFEFHSDGALLQGKRDFREDICGGGDDFDWHTWLKDRADDSAPPEMLHVDFREDGRVDVKLALSDGDGELYRFVDVAPGKPVTAAVDGDCRRRKVSVTYTATQSPQCLIVDTLNMPAHDLVRMLRDVASVQVDGFDLLIPGKDRVTFRHLELSTTSLLRLLGDVANLQVVVRDPTHFELRPFDKAAAH